MNECICIIHIDQRDWIAILIFILVCLDYNNTCNPNQWKCPSTGECIYVTQICDSTEDCKNGEDEGSDDQQCSEFCILIETTFKNKKHTAS